MDYVVGSGPSGVAAASALGAAGRRVTILDAGVDMEPAKQMVQARLGAVAPEDWDPADLVSMKSGMRAGAGGVPRKLVAGSSFPYDHAAESIGMEGKNVDFSPSFALGGLSNVWGSAVLPFRAEDIPDWTVSLQDLQAGYEAVLRLLPFSAAEDDLAPAFPLHAAAQDQLTPSGQGRAFLNDLAHNRERLRARGIEFGAPRLAVRARRGGGGCVYCGLCLYGCPYGFIYNSRDTLKQMLASDAVEYIPNVVVERVRESGDGVSIEARDRVDALPRIFEGERVFLATGVLPTARIVLSSLGEYSRALEMKYSQYFILPFLRFRGVPNVAKERLHTLAQAFVEVQGGLAGQRSAHLQFYGYNDLYEGVLRRMAGPFYQAFQGMFDRVLGRLMIIQGYLHSDDSPSVSIRLEKSSSGGPDRLLVEGGINRSARLAVRRLTSLLLRNAGALGGVVVAPMVRLARPGGAYHNGGTLPMRRQPSHLETDRWGRLKGFERLHVVDASVLPSIPATTITLSTMANAYRIATGVSEGMA